MDYKDKYIKYKTKYLQLKNKNNMIGGHYISNYTILYFSNNILSCKVSDGLDSELVCNNNTMGIAYITCRRIN